MLLVDHVRSVANKWADTVSRLGEGKALPAALVELGCRFGPVGPSRGDCQADSTGGLLCRRSGAEPYVEAGWGAALSPVECELWMIIQSFGLIECCVQEVAGHIGRMWS